MYVRFIANVHCVRCLVVIRASQLHPYCCLLQRARVDCREVTHVRFNVVDFFSCQRDGPVHRPVGVCKGIVAKITVVIGDTGMSIESSMGLNGPFVVNLSANMLRMTAGQPSVVLT